MGADASKPAEAEEPVLSVDEKKRQIARMDDIVRNRVRGGIQYNMKIVLCGARGTGKTSLFNRFQGLSFSSNYTPTSEIQSATINWTFKNNADHVKVEVWDVVDVALNKKTPSKKPVYDGTNTGQHVIELLDSTVVDIYKGTQAVIFLINPFSRLSYIYVRDKFKEVPVDISILLILNFRDVKDGGDIPDACKSNTPNEPKITMQDVQVLCNEINAFRQKTAYPYNPAVATAAAVAESNAKPAEVSKSLNEIAKEKQQEEQEGSTAAEKVGSEVKEEGSGDAPVDDMTKLTLQNIDKITSTHKTEHPVEAGAHPSHSIIDSKRSLNTNTEGVHAFEISLNNCFGLLHVHKFLDIPFLKLKKQTLLEVLNKVDEELVDSNLTLRNTVLTANYQEYETLHAKRVKDREAAVAAQAAAAAASPAHTSLQQQQQMQQMQQQQQMAANMNSSNPLGNYVSQIGGGGGDSGKYNSANNATASAEYNSSVGMSKSRDEESDDDEGGFLALKRTPLVKGKRKTKIIKPEIEDPTPVTPKSSTVFKLSHNDEYEALSVNKKSAPSSGGGGLEKELRKSKKDKKKEVTPEPPPRVLSQFEQEVESFQPAMEDGFFDPSDDDEKRRVESKQRVRGALKSNEISGVVTSKMNAKDLSVLSPTALSGSSSSTAKQTSGGTPPSAGSYGGGGGGGSVKLRGGQTVDVSKSRSKDDDEDDMDAFLASPSTSTRKSASGGGGSLTRVKKTSSKASIEVSDEEDEAPVKISPVRSSGGLRKPVKKSKALPDMEL